MFVVFRCTLQEKAMLALIYPTLPRLSWSATIFFSQESRQLIFKVQLLAMAGRILCTRYNVVSFFVWRSLEWKWSKFWRAFFHWFYCSTHPIFHSSKSTASQHQWCWSRWKTRWTTAWTPLDCRIGSPRIHVKDSLTLSWMAARLGRLICQEASQERRQLAKH